MPVPSTSGVETNSRVLFQPIFPANVTPTQHQDQALYNSSLNLIDDSSRPQTSGSTAHRPQQPAPHVTMPPTPYVNQAMVNQHMNKQHPAQPCGAPAGTGNPPQQQVPPVGTPLHPPSARPAPFPTFQSLPVDTRTKSKNGQGIKRSKKSPADKPDTICWRCKQPGHLKHDCPMPPFCVKCRQEGHLPYNCLQQNNRNTSANISAQATVNHQFSNIRNNCIHCGGLHKPAACPTRAGLHTASTAPKGTQQPGIISTGMNNTNVFPPQCTVNGLSTTANTPPMQVVNNLPMQHGHMTANQVPRATPQVSPHMSQSQHNAQHIQNQFAPPAYFPITFLPPPIAPSNVSAVPSPPTSDLSAAITLMMNAVNQGHSNTTMITDALQTMTSQFADALQKTIQMGVDAQAEETQNARLDKQFDKIKIFDGSNPAECHPWLEEVHALCLQTGRPFREMLQLCAGQAVRDFISDMSPNATDDQMKNDLIAGYSDLQGLSCKQAAYDNISQRPDEPLRSYIVRYSRLFRLLNGTAPNDIVMRTTSMHFVNSLRSYLSSKVKNRLLGMNEKNYSLGDTFRVVLECELKAIASERWHNKRNIIATNNINVGEQIGHNQLEDINEIHVRNPNYKGKNYDPNYQAKKAEANKQQQQFSTANGNQYKAPYNKLMSGNDANNLASSSDIAGEVTLKTSVDGYQLLKMNELIKNAAAWRARMPKTSKYDKYFDSKDNSTNLPNPKVQINEDTLAVMGQTARDCGYTKDEFIEAVEMYEHFGNVSLEDVPVTSLQD